MPAHPSAIWTLLRLNGKTTPEGGGGTAPLGDGGGDEANEVTGGTTASGGESGCKEPLGCERNSACGDGIVASDDSEDCDMAGNSPTCHRTCETFECRLGCQCLFEHGEIYMFYKSLQVSRAEAQQSCEDNGLGLIRIHDARENSLVAHRLNVTRQPTAWIGASDSEEEGIWRWDDSTPFWFGNSSGEPVDDLYSSWIPSGEPNDGIDGAPSEDCAQIVPEGRWYDIPCDDTLGYVCASSHAISAECGNGQLDAQEGCDDGEESAACDSDCTASRCGDGVYNQQAGEECDDGNSESLDSCSNDCKRTGLVGFWPLDERTSNVAFDLSEMNQNGTLQSKSFSAGDTGVSLNENSPGESIVVPFAEAQAFTHNFTLAVHVRPTGDPNHAGYLLIRKGQANSKLLLRFFNSSIQAGTIVADGTDEYLISAPIPDIFESPTWHHLAATYDGEKYALYFDGQFLTDFGNQRDPVPAVEGWRIGGDRTSGHFYQGRMANVRIYDRALSGDEVSEIAGQTPQ